MLTLFSWGYEGWGNWTDKLVEAVDAVEASRGWGPPIFVDVRAKRAVRAEGFREKAFERRFGNSRYRWMRGLGNAALDGEARVGLVDAREAAGLLDLAQEMATERRRVIFFCSCVSPSSGCHRHWVTEAVLEEAERRGLPVTVVEWPGYESEPAENVRLEVKPAQAKTLGDQRKSLPLGQETPDAAILGRPWFSLAKVTSDGFVLTGPAQHRAGGWQLPILSQMCSLNRALLLQLNRRRSTRALPVAGHAHQPNQQPREILPEPPFCRELRLGPGDCLHSAFERVGDGGAVELGSGRFELTRSLILHQSLTLRGRGRDSTEIVCTAPGAVLCLEGSGTWTLTDLTIRHIGVEVGSGLVVDQGRVEIEGCRFAGARSSEEGDWGEGLAITGTATARVRGCEAVDNSHGFVGYGYAKLSVEECISSGNEWGIAFCGYSEGVARSNVCRENEAAGILVNCDANAEVEGNLCERNGVGIQFDDSATGLLKGNRCLDNRTDSIRIGEDATPTAVDNEPAASAAH